MLSVANLEANSVSVQIDQDTMSPAADNAITSSTRVSVEDGDLICRYCHDVDSIDNLKQPCKCAGSLKYVHQTCLLIWLEISEKEKCGVCSEKYIIERKLQPIREVMERYVYEMINMWTLW